MGFLVVDENSHLMNDIIIFHKKLHHIRHVAVASLDMPSEHGVADFEMLSWLSVTSSRGALFSRGDV